MGTCLYVAEGEIEKRFLTEIKQLEYFVPGKFMKYNLMHNRIKYSDYGQEIFSNNLCYRYRLFGPYTVKNAGT